MAVLNRLHRSQPIELHAVADTDLYQRDRQSECLRVMQLCLTRLGVDGVLRQREDEHVAATYLFEDRAPPCLTSGEALVHPHLLVGVLQILGETFDGVRVSAGVANYCDESGSPRLIPGMNYWWPMSCSTSG
jgi:hypothetical protein